MVDLKLNLEGDQLLFLFKNYMSLFLFITFYMIISSVLQLMLINYTCAVNFTMMRSCAGQSKAFETSARWAPDIFSLKKLCCTETVAKVALRFSEKSPLKRRNSTLSNKTKKEVKCNKNIKAFYSCLTLATEKV